MFKKTCSYTYMVLLGLVLSACSILPKPEYIPRQESIDTKADLAFNFSSNGLQESADDKNLSSWFASDDKTLNYLVSQCLENNLSIATAKSRLRQSELGLVRTRSSQLPTISGSGLGQRSQDLDESDSFELYTLGLDGFYEVDLFGRRSSEIAAALYNISTAELSLESTQVALLSELTLAYINYQSAQRRLNVSERRSEVQAEILQIAKWRQAAGLGSELDVLRSESLYRSTLATIPLLKSAVNRSVTQLSVLTSIRTVELLSHLNRSQNNLIVMKRPVQTALSDLLRKRPDIMSAEQNFFRSVSEIGITRAELFPSLTLTGALTTSGLELSDLFDSTTSRLSASIFQTIFDNKRRSSINELSKERAEEAFILFQQAILGAMTEFEDAAYAFNNLKASLEELNLSVSAASKVVDISKSLYSAGSISFQEILSVERSLLELEDQQVSTAGQLVEAALLAYVVSGEGWEYIENVK